MPEAGWQQLVIPFAFMIVLLIFFWWIVVRPTQVRQKKHQDLVSSIMPGDPVVTVGGIYGTVKKVQDKTVDIEVARETTVTVDRRAIRRLQNQEDF